jgi:hypothetical protein
MSWGGKRVGAGRKPRSGRSHWLTGDAGKRNLSLVTNPVASDEAPAAEPSGAVVVSLRDAPAMLTETERPYWELWSPLALLNATLTDQTVPGFVLLCQVASRAANLWGNITAQGFVYEKVMVDGAGVEHKELKSHPLLTHYRGLMQRQEQLLARYGLASMGKPPGDKKPKKDDERDELRKLLAVR